MWLNDLHGVRDSIGLGISQRARLNRLIPAPSYHCGHWTLILCAGTLDPWMHRCVACTKLMATLLLTYPHILEQGCCHFVARWMAILFRVAGTSTPSRPPTEATKGKKWSAFIEACLQVHLLLFPFCFPHTLSWCIFQMGLSVSVHNAYVMNTVITIIPEVKDQEVSLLLCGL